MPETELLEALSAVGGAWRYRDWILQKVRPALGRVVLDIGSGLGDFIAPFTADQNRKFILSDASSIMVKKLQQRFAGMANAEVVRLDIAGRTVSSRPLFFGSEVPDTVTCLNVLEHIKDDGLALRNIRDIVPKGGKLALFVPAVRCLYGSFDRLAGHYRRYSRQGVLRALERSGWRVLGLEYHNFFGLFSWFIGGKILRQKMMDPAQCNALDRLVPWVSFLEKRIRPPLGQSLFAIAVNPE